MAKHRLKMVSLLLLISGLSACESGGGSLPATNSTSKVPFSATSDLTSRNTSSIAQTATSQYIAIDAGTAAASGIWIADSHYTMSGYSGVAAVSTLINTSNVPHPAPQAVYQTQRWATHLSYSVPKLTAGAGYTVRLSFVESYFNTAGARVFGVTINGIQQLSNFDIFASAGGANIAIVRTFATTADSTGKIAIKMDASRNNASISGIEVSSVAVVPTPTPSPSAVPSPAPSPSPSQIGRPTAHPGFGPRAAVGPQPSITCAPNSVNITSTSGSIQTIVNAHSPGTNYCLAAGTYSAQSINPQSGDTYVGVNGAVLNGGGTANFAFYDYSNTTTNVTIKNLTIENYAPGSEQGEIFGSRSTSTGWNVSNNTIESSASYGIYASGGWNIVGNYIYNNQQGGYALRGTGDHLTDNEISTNNTNQITYPFNSDGGGGGKAFETTNATASYNYVHDNVGPGIWNDTDNQGVTEMYNDSENNARAGIMHEISWDAVIQHNYLAGNGNSVYGAFGCLQCGGIFISNSGGETGKVVDVSYNTIIASGYGGGIGLMNVTRGSSLVTPYGTWLTQNVQVHNNTISLSTAGSYVGAYDADGSDPAMFTTQGNSFDYDTMEGAGTGSDFYWGPGTSGSFHNFAGFQANGREPHGTSL